MTNSVLLPQVAQALRKAGILYEVFVCDPELADTAQFCEHYGFSLDQSANTIVVASRKAQPVRYAVCVVLGTTKLDVNKKVYQLLGVKRASFARAEETQRLTGMMIGGVTPFGIDGLPLYIDSLVLQQEKVITGGGNRSSKVILNPRELTKLPSAHVVDGLARPGP